MNKKEIVTLLEESRKKLSSIRARVWNDRIDAAIAALEDGCERCCHRPDCFCPCHDAK